MGNGHKEVRNASYEFGPRYEKYVICSAVEPYDTIATHIAHHRLMQLWNVPDSRLIAHVPSDPSNHIP